MFSKTRRHNLQISQSASRDTPFCDTDEFRGFVQSQVIQIGDRLDTSVSLSYQHIAPSTEATLEACRPFPIEILERGIQRGISEGGLDGMLGEFVDHLRKWHFAIVRLEDETSIQEMWEVSRAFYSLENHENRRTLVGPVRSEVEDASLVVGYVALDDNEFLETRTGPNSSLHPSSLRELPCGDDIPGSNSTVLKFIRGRKMLTIVGKVAVAAVAIAGSNDANSWLQLVDDGENVPEGTVSASVHRFCRYQNRETPESREPSSRPIGFGAHTDSTFFTVIPVSTTPGLQVCSSSETQLPIQIRRLAQCLTGRSPLRRSSPQRTAGCAPRSTRLTGPTSSSSPASSRRSFPTAEFRARFTAS
jgi:hypothetical protein